MENCYICCRVEKIKRCSVEMTHHFTTCEERVHPKLVHEILRALSCVKHVPRTSPEQMHTVIEVLYFLVRCTQAAITTSSQVSYKHKTLGSLSSVVSRGLCFYLPALHTHEGPVKIWLSIRMIKFALIIAYKYSAI